MAHRAHDLVVIPDSFWQQSETVAALRGRSIGQLFALVHQRTRASQTQIGMACGGLTQGKVSDIIRGVHEVKHLGGHLDTAISISSSHAARLDRDIAAHTPDSLSVYGGLLLHGSVAAAQLGNRAAAHELLGEADAAGERLGFDGNLRWTAFGPTNVKFHRVNIAVALGDAGTAVDIARRTNPATVTVTERRATVLVDTARAFLQWGKHEKAYIALRAAEEIAHEEVAGRPSVHRVIRELVTSAPPSIRREAQEFATQLGVSRD
jgi:hypothetical protein